VKGTEELLELANKALPGAWDALIRQAYIYGIGSMIIAVISIIIAITLFLKLDTCGSEMKEGDYPMFVGMIATALVFLVFLAMGTLYLANPGYYAIQMLKPQL